MGGRWFGVLIAVLVAWGVAPASAQDNFPSRSIRIVMPYGPGSVADVFAPHRRAEHGRRSGTGPIVFESKSGANGSIAAEDVARSAPDGYTWLMVTTFFIASPALYKELRWDPLRDFVPVGADLPGAEFLHRAVQPAGEERRRICRPRQVKAGHAELQPSRQGLDRPSRLRAVQEGRPGSMSPASAIAAIRRWCLISPRA